MLSIIIVNWNTRDLLRACIRSLQAHPFRAGQEILVIDNASADGSAAMVREEFPSVILRANDANLGYAAGTNQGLRLARGDLFLLLNPDTEALPGTLDTLAEGLREHPEAAGVAPRLVGPDGILQHSVRGFPAPGALLAEALGLARLFPRSRRLGAYRMRYWRLDDEREVDQPMASCLLLRRAALEQVGLLDEEFPIFFNDVDWCYRARAHGWTIRFTPRATLVHHGGASTKQVRPAMLRESGRSLERFYRKHYRGRVFAPLYWGALSMLRLGNAVRCAICDARSGMKTSGTRGGFAIGEGEGGTPSGIPHPPSPIPRPASRPDLTVSVVNWKTPDDTTACLASILANDPDGPDTRVVVVDNNSGDGSAELLAERFPQVLLVANEENRGFGAANNQVLKGSDSRYVFLLNPDATTHSGTLTALVRFMDENPEVGICGPLILNPDGSVQYSARRFPTLLAGAFRNTLLGRLFPNNRYTREYLLSDWDHRSQPDVDWLSGAALMIRREVIDRVGVFDERFFMYSEDVDLCYRAGKAGWRITFYPGASVTHARAHSSDQAQGKMLIQFHRSMYRFWQKHYAPRTFWPLRLVVPGIIALRALLLLAKNGTDRLRKRLTQG